MPRSCPKLQRTASGEGRTDSAPPPRDQHSHTRRRGAKCHRPRALPLPPQAAGDPPPEGRCAACCAPGAPERCDPSPTSKFFLVPPYAAAKQTTLERVTVEWPCHPTTSIESALS